MFPNEAAPMQARVIVNIILTGIVVAGVVGVTIVPCEAARHVGDPGVATGHQLGPGGLVIAVIASAVRDVGVHFFFPLPPSV